jgi:predicted phosphodiesterase
VKLAVLADIHGNLAALEAVADDLAAWQPDAIVVAGDIVNRGPLPLACLRFVQARATDAGWRLLRGNHEDYVLEVARNPHEQPPGVEGAVRDNVRWTLRAMHGAEGELALLPEIVRLDTPGGEARAVHASMRHNRDNILVTTPDEELRLQIAPAPPLICVGHTHRPLVRRIDETLVVNVGSVGMPFDGDTRASYGRITWRGAWEAQITRVPYDRERTMRDFAETGYLSESGPVAAIVYDEFLNGLPRLFGWVQLNRDPVLARTITVEESVRAYLEMVRG